MGRKPKTSRPSFFKVLIKDDYTDRLRLPHVFVRKYGKFLPENAKLRTSSGGTWDVKIEEIEDDDKFYCFTKGWNKFVKDLEVEMLEFVVFWFNIGESTFDVSIYAINGCEREISANNLLAVDSDDADESFDFEIEDGHHVPEVNKKQLRRRATKSEATGRNAETECGNSEEETRPRFEVVMTESRKLRVCLYKEFAAAAGLIGKRSVVLEYPPKQRYWAVILDQRPRPYHSLQLAVGWCNFRKENGLVVGKTYSFEFDPIKNVIQVKEKKRRTAR